MEIETINQEIDQSYITELVQKMHKRSGLHISHCEARSIHGGVEEGSSVYRVQGEARDDGETIQWSMILKTVCCTEKAKHPDGIWYWKREAEAYQSGMLHHLPGGKVIAPACHGVEQRPDGSLWLWLEDVKDDVGTPWPVEQYATAARHLGQFNGAYLTGKPIPHHSWITHNWLRMYVENAAPMIEFIHRNPDHPVVSHMFPGDAKTQVLAIWDAHAHILDVLENLPQVFCHQDAFKRNLFARGGQTIVIDWGYMGNAPVGAELVALVAGSIGFYEIPVEKVEELDRLCFEGYMQGLREAGWQGAPKVVRTGYAVTLMLRYPIGASVGEMLPQFIGKEHRLKVDTAFDNKTADDLQKTDPALIAYYQKMLPEAMKLLGLRRLLEMVGRIGVYKLRLKPGK